MPASAMPDNADYPTPPECTCGPFPTPTQHDYFCPWREWWLGLTKEQRVEARKWGDHNPDPTGHPR